MAAVAGRRWLEGRSQAAPSLAFWGGMALAVLGFMVNGMWRLIPWEGTTTLVGLALLSLLAAVVLRRATRMELATASTIIWLAALVYFVGGTDLAAVFLLMLAAMAVGTLVVPEDWSARPYLSVLAGLGIIAGTTGWLLPFPVHYRVVYVLLLLTLVAIRWRPVMDVLGGCRKGWYEAVQSAPAAAWFTATIAGTATACAWLPTIGYDDLALHLALPAQLQELGYYQMNAASNVWALAAWSADVVQGIASVVTGHMARGTVDILWLVCTLGLLWKLCETLGLRPWLRWLGVALYASLPMTAFALGDMHTEGPTAALVVGIAWLIQRSTGPCRRQLLALAVLFGTLLALKISNLMVAGPLGLWLLCRWRGRLPWRAMPLALLLTLLVAGSSYAYAWALTGNPVLPMFNGIFHSSFFKPANFHDSHWDSGFGWSIPWNLVFHSSAFFEGEDGAAGFAIIALGACALAALARRDTRPLALVALCAFFLPLTQIQYLRYAHPALAILIPVALGSVPMTASDAAPRSRAVMAALGLLTLADLMFVPAASWQLAKGAMWTFIVAGRQEFLAQYAPIYRLAEVAAERYGEGARVFATSPETPYAAPFAGKAFVVNWYDPRLSTRAAHADRDSSGAAWAALLEQTGVNLVVLQQGHVSAGLATAVVAADGKLVERVADLQLWELTKGRQGVARASTGRAIGVNFDTSGLPAGPVLAHAELVLQCVQTDTPVVVSWTVTAAEEKPWTYYEWAHCLADGTARPVLEVASPNKIIGFAVVLQPQKDVDIGLGVTSAKLDVHKDMTAEHDLSARMRRDWFLSLADALDPWERAGVMHPGVPNLAAPDAVTTNFDVRSVTSNKNLVRARLELSCVDRGVPIVVAWKIADRKGPLLSRYEWTYCVQGKARASLDAKVKGHVASFEVDATPSKPLDLAIRFSGASAGFLDARGLSGRINCERMNLSQWLKSQPSVERLGQPST